MNYCYYLSDYDRVVHLADVDDLVADGYAGYAVACQDHSA